VSHILRTTVRLASQIGASRAGTVLICGETGTGKELFARGIHAAGAAPHEPFVAINCAAIPETLLESELFGHEKGAFTDARSLKRGLLEVAGRGTLFLDEVGELPLKLQPKLLRVLEQRTFRRLGGSDELGIHARIIAATNVALEEAVDERVFREDLFYRLNAVRLDLPPLRERGGDVEVLARHFLAAIASENGTPVPVLAGDAVDALNAHPWPGNIRELKNIMERAVIVAGGAAIGRRHLQFQRRRVALEMTDGGTSIRIPPDGKSLEAIVAEAVHVTLVLAHGNLSKTARMLGISRPTLARKMRSAGLMRRSVVGAP